MRPIPVVAAGVLTCLTLAGCTSDPTSTPSALSQSSTAASGASSIAPATDLVPGALTVTMPEGWRDDSLPAILHSLAPDVATNPRAERWADIMIYEATSAIDPSTGEQLPLPADPAAWLRANPLVEVLDERTVQVAGRSATLIDAAILEDGWAFNGSEAAIQSFANGHERFILIPVGNRWVVVQASTFRGAEGLAEPDGPDDALAGVLESIGLPS